MGSNIACLLSMSIIEAVSPGSRIQMKKMRNHKKEGKERTREKTQTEEIELQEEKKGSGLTSRREKTCLTGGTRSKL